MNRKRLVEILGEAEVLKGEVREARLIEIEANKVGIRGKNTLTGKDLHAVIGGVKIAYASDLGWPMGYWPSVIKVDGVFHRMEEKTPEDATYRSIAGRSVVIFNS